MLSKFFVALNFRSDSVLSRKIDGFKKRYDPKYKQRAFFHMALLAPFEINAFDAKKMQEELREELESFFFGQESALKLAFTGVGIFQAKRKNIVHLIPSYCPDMQFCSDLVLDICTSFIPRNIKYKKNDSQFLPLGTFSAYENLEEVIQQLKLEFSRNGELAVEGISLYEQKSGFWQLRENLIAFDEVDERFLQRQYGSL